MNTKDLADNIKTFTGQFEAHLKKHGADLSDADLPVVDLNR